MRTSRRPRPARRRRARVRHESRDRVSHRSSVWSSRNGNCAGSPPSWPGWTSSRRCRDARVHAERQMPCARGGRVEAAVRPGPVPGLVHAADPARRLRWRSDRDAVRADAARAGSAAASGSRARLPATSSPTRDAHWNWYADHWNTDEVVKVVEEVIGDGGRPRWIDYRMTFATVILEMDSTSKGPVQSNAA